MEEKVVVERTQTPKRHYSTEEAVSRMKKAKIAGKIIGAVSAFVILFVAFYLCLLPLNPHSAGLWVMVALAGLAYTFIQTLVMAALCSGCEQIVLDNGRTAEEEFNRTALWILPFVGLLIVVLLILISGSTMFHASRYASILKVQDAEFSEDLSEAVGTDSIALMDTASAKMLGDREIGSLASVVSQYNVSDSYTQIDLNGTPKKIAALDYAGFFKWINNKENGVPGYVIVDPVSMSASYQECENAMVYVPSACFSEDAARHIRMKYPTTMFGNLHFEIDEEGKPFYIASVYDMTISLFGGKTVKGCIILDPVSGSVEQLALDEIPAWVDDVYDGELICEQYNWFGKLQNGFWNSMFSKKGCKQVTQYIASEDEDDAPASDYGYVAKDGDIWIYTGITSVNNDSSNIGFLLANERTGESHYFSISGADEKSAMAAAEGEVQEKGYQASFPSLINVDGNPTYIMVLKDASGLVKLYAAVNVQQYNLVTTAASQTECMAKYRQLLGLSSEAADGEDGEVTEVRFCIQEIRYVTIDGNTFIYLIDESDNLYRGMAKNHEELLLLEAGDTVELEARGKEIVSCQRAAKKGE